MDPYFPPQSMPDRRNRQNINQMNAMYMQNQMGMHPQQMTYGMHMQQPMMYGDNTQYIAPPNTGGGHGMTTPMESGYGYYDPSNIQPTNIFEHADIEPLPVEETSGKRHAPRSAFPDYKTPPHLLYVKDKNETVASTETKMRNLTVEDKIKTTPIEQPDIKLDLGVLAKLLGTDPTLITSDQIRTFMATPDLRNIYRKLQEEEERKQKRLARNRDLAGQRRKRSKELVETYEAEVKELQNILAKSLAHKFGQGDIKTLLEALGGDARHNVNLTKDKKHEQTAELLKQLLRHASAIRQASDDNWMLTMASTDDPNFEDLKNAIGLTDEQCEQIQQLKPQVHDESTRLTIVEKCFAALHANEWLHFPHTENLVDLFRAPLNDTQLQKFVQWTRVNQRIIQKLQFAIALASDAKDKDIFFEFPSEL